MRRLLTTALAVSLLSGLITVAEADGRDRHGYRHEPREQHHHHGDRHRDHHRSTRGHYASDWHPHHRHVQRTRYHRPHDYHHRAWRRGDRLPWSYRASHYYVTDYYSYRLRPPPRGYHWIRVDDDVLLTAIATGVVVQVVDGLFW